MLRQVILLSVFFTTLFVCACGGEGTTTAEGNGEPTPDPLASEPNIPAEEILYTWVDGLNVRDQPSTKGTTVARVKPNEPLTFTGEKSPESETIVLRGVAYHEPWFKITTADKKDGWVFGGAVKRKDQLKGNATLSDTKFEFPVFGYYDLGKWEQVARNNDGTGGDAESETITYRSEDQLLKITKVEVGEYGYNNAYELLDKAGNTLKERTFEFAVDPELKITETVIDHTDTPAKRYTRSQVLDKHFMMLNERPEMVLGNWEIGDVD
jgi:hypothetical protein